MFRDSAGDRPRTAALAFVASATSKVSVARRSALAIPITMSLVVLIASQFPVAPLRDAATLQGIDEVYLTRPDAYIAFAPFSDLFDAITLLSERQHIAVLLGLLAIWCLYRFACRFGLREGWRESIRSFATLCVAIVVVYAIAAYLPRPMAHVQSVDPDVLRVDFHSHTRNSKDARRHYSVERNRTWHHAGGYDVAYVTDHGTFAGAERGLAKNPRTGSEGVVLLEGLEASWKGEHVGVLGDEDLSRRELSSDLHDFKPRLPAIAGSRSARAPVVVWNHPRDPRLEDLPLVSGVVQAIEITNGAPQGLDLTHSKRQRIVALARQHNLALLSGTDSHGWGYTAPSWTLLRLKGWRRLDRNELALRIEGALRTGGFGATHVVERATVDPGSSATALAFSVVLVPWRMLTELSTDERRMWLVWTWVIAGVGLQLRQRRVARRVIAESPAG